jgi:hypothetical protein
MFDKSFVILPKDFFIQYFEMWERDVKLSASREASLEVFFYVSM